MSAKCGGVTGTVFASERQGTYEVVWNRNIQVNYKYLKIRPKYTSTYVNVLSYWFRIESAPTV